MKLEDLQKRLSDVLKAIEETTQRGYMLIGHKGELEFQIAELEKPIPEVTPADQVTPTEGSTDGN